MFGRVAAVIFIAQLIAGCQGSAVTRQETTSAPVTQLVDRNRLPANAIDANHSLPANQPSLGSYSPSHSMQGQHAVAKPLPWQQSINSLYDKARKLVERELQVDLQHVRLMLVDDNPINQEVARETQRLVRNQFGDSEFADKFLSNVMASQAGTYAALFSSRLKAIMVSRTMLHHYELSLPDDAQLHSSALLTLLVHELVHAADDHRYHIHANRALNFRASFAQSAIFEGHAQWVTRRICAQHGCIAGLKALDNFMFSPETQVNQQTQPVEAISRNVLEYSYIEGERFITELAKRPNGKFLIDSLLRSPPEDPIQILAPENYPDTDREKRNQRLLKASMNINHPWISDQWIGIQTSPLKGVNLRADPSRRQAAVDGFTRLIQGMIALQLYDKEASHQSPLEVTLLHAESAYTARLFARTLHNNTHSHGSIVNDEPLRVRIGAGKQQSQMKTHIYRTVIDSESPYRTTVAVSGPYVVQISGNTDAAAQLDDYAIRVLLNLQLESI